MSTYHVLPVDEQSDDCVCGPTVESVPPGWVVCHQALDGRD